MKLAAQIAAAVSTAFFVVLTVTACVLVVDELDFVDDQLDRHGRLLGRVVARAARETLAARGPVAAQDLLRDIDRQEPTIAIRWLTFGEVAGPPTRLEEDVQAALRRGEVVGRVSPTNDDTLYTYVPAESDGGPPRVIQIAESLGARDAHVRSLLARVVAAMALGLVASASLAWILGRQRIGRPITDLVATARRIGQGDFAARADERGGHELGDLAAAMNEMTAQLSEAQRLAREQDEARRRIEGELRHADRLATLGQLASGVAHEIGTPLQAITTRASVVASEAGHDERIGEHMEAIARHSGRVARLVRSLLRFARRQPARRDPHDLRDVIEDSLALVSTATDAGDDEVVRRLPPEPAVALVDAEQIGQVVTNLVINGLHAIRAGGSVTILLDRIEAHPPTASPAITGPYFRIRVQDDGPGIPRDIAPHVFDPFFTTKDVDEGTGLGLSVAYGIVKEHAGWIDLAANPGHGARFDVYLPALRAGSPQPQSDPA